MAPEKDTAIEQTPGWVGLPANEPEDIIGSCPIDVLELEQGLQFLRAGRPTLRDLGRTEPFPSEQRVRTRLLLALDRSGKQAANEVALQ